MTGLELGLDLHVTEAWYEEAARRAAAVGRASQLREFSVRELLASALDDLGVGNLHLAEVAVASGAILVAEGTREVAAGQVVFNYIRYSEVITNRC